jgi:leukotriene-A4 hydrolase
LRQFAGTVGRGLLIRPLYTGLKRQGAWGDAIARDLFARSRATYHPAVASGIEKILAGD